MRSPFLCARRCSPAAALFSRVALAVVAAGAAPLFASTAAPPAAGADPSRSVVQEGLRIDFDLVPLDAGRPAGPPREGEPVAVRFTVSDQATGQPLPGLDPGGWMDRLPQAAAEPADCKAKLANFLGGSLLAEPEVDLNVFYVVALNSDGTLTVVDPLFGFGGSKLLALIVLPAPGEDWVLDAAGERIYVAVPKLGRVAVVDTSRWKIAAEVEVGGLPSRLALQPDGRYLWVGDGAPGASSGVVVVDTSTLAVAARIPTGAGYHDLAFDRDGRYAFVTNRDAASLSAVEIGTLRRVRDLPVGARPTSIDYSPMADSVYVSSASGTITAVDARRLERLAEIPAEPGLAQLRFAPGGRLAFVVNPEADVVHILDAASHRLVQTADLEDGPEHLAFTETLAYVRHRNDSTVLMIPLDQVGQEGRPVPVVDFPGGQRAYGEAALPSPAPSIVQAPGHAAVLVANPADEMIYFYKEGMAAPMGSFRNYGREPRAVLVVDRSLAERRPGVYETRVALRRAGRYDLVFFLDAPRVVHCFPFEVAANPELEAKRRQEMGVAIEFLAPPAEVAVGEPVRLSWRVRDAATGALRQGVPDLRALVFLVPGLWQERQWALPLGEGRYEIEFVPREAGIYRVQVESRSLALTLNRSPSLSLTALAKPETLPAAAPADDDPSRKRGEP
jgi:YVTN family beta-propeller protein